MLTDSTSSKSTDDPKLRRVLLITARADHGGGPRHILDLLTAFSRSSGLIETEFHIAAPNQEPYAPQFKELAKSFVEIPARSFSLSILFRLLQFVRHHRIDIVHSHGRGAGFYSRLLGFFSGAHVIHTFHGIHRDPSFSGRVKLWLDQFLSRFSFTPVFVSENEQQEALKFGCVQSETKGFVVENAVDLSRFTAIRTPAFSDTTRPLKFGAFLRADLAKGPDRLLRLARESAKESATFSSWTCAGISKEELDKFGKVPVSLSITGKVPDPAKWLQSLDVFVSTARNEGLPLGVLEAMAAGCVCILSDIPAHSEFKNRGAALLFDAEISKAFVSEVESLKTNPARRADLLTAAHRLLQERHSLENFREKLQAVYARF